jgi:type IX secretion system PorP/SprF family membrane protein
MRELILILLIGCATASFGQQDYQFTQFHFNKLAFNPAYAGTDNLISLTGMYRRQWAGLDGAPQTGSFTMHAPVFHERIGLGLHVYNDQHGVTDNLGVMASYAYKVPLGGSVLSFGLQGGIINYRASLTDLNPLNPDDPAFSQDLTELKVNFGTGLFWYIPQQAFLGVSMPRFLENDLGQIGVDAEEVATLSRHVYAMGGYVFDISRDFKLRPAALFKMVGPGSAQGPLDVDLALHALIAQRIWIGADYRLGDAVGVMTEVLATDQLMIGYAYDLGISDLADYHNGSHEVVLRYQFQFRKDAHVNPRMIQYF